MDKIKETKKYKYKKLNIYIITISISIYSMSNDLYRSNI